jgi:hypothetical protein
MIVCAIFTRCNILFLYFTEGVGEELGAVAHKGLLSVFKLHLRNVTREILWGHKHASYVQLSKLVCLAQIVKDNISFVGSRGVGRPLTGTNWHKPEAHFCPTLSTGNTALPEQPEHKNNRRRAT